MHIFFKTFNIKNIDGFMLQSEYIKFFIFITFFAINSMTIQYWSFRNLEQVILVLKEMNQLDEVPKLAHTACSLYQQHGSPESGATVLDKGAKMLEATRPEQALELYRRAADVVMVWNKF